MLADEWEEVLADCVSVLEKAVRQMGEAGMPVPTVEFYRSMGWEVTGEPNAEMLRAEPEDVHMILTL